MRLMRPREWWLRRAELEESPMANCILCGEPMPPGEEMFKYHGYSCDCPRPPLRPSDPLRRVKQMTPAEQAVHQAITEVERLPPAPRLTTAIVLLQRAQSAIADWVDLDTKKAPEGSPEA